MIAHVSVPSQTPKDTALFFARIIDGLAFDFPVVPGASIAVANDGSGTAIEVYPPAMSHHPGTGQPDPTMVTSGPATMPWEDQIFPDGTGGAASPFHLAIETKLSEAEVVAEAKSRGWRSASCERGGVFGVVEVWVDNKYLVEVLVAEQAVRYRQFMRPSGCSAMFGEGVSAPFTRNS